MNSLLPGVLVLFTMFFLHIFPGFILFRFLVTVSFHYFHVVVKKIFRLILMDHTLVDDA